MDTLEALMSRRSVRDFTDQPVTDAQLEVVLRAAMAAPSATNEQPWRFVVVRDPQRIARLALAKVLARPLKTAPAAIVVCADRTAAKTPGFWVIDCSAAIQNALLAAHATGLGAVWMGVHPITPFVAGVRRIIGAPRHVVPHSIIAIGHPAQTPPPIDRYRPEWIHEETW